MSTSSSSNSRTYTLYVHDAQFSSDELLINPDLFPHAKVGDLYQISNPDKPNKSVTLRLNTIAKPKGNIQVSVSKYIANVFELTALRNVSFEKVSPESASIEFVEIAFKDQYIGRSDMWRLKLSMQNTCVYLGKVITFSYIRANVKELISNGKSVYSGLITENTKFIFRSRSANIFLFFQMSREMWEFADDGELYFEKAVNTFLKELYDRWNQTGTTHSVTIVFFSRTYYEADSVPVYQSEWSPTDPDASYKIAETFLNTDTDGRKYQDFYKVICDTKLDYQSLSTLLKKEFVKYPEYTDWSPFNNKHRHSKTYGTNSTSAEGNLLESINMAMHVFNKRYIDRDLSCTGELIIVVTAGTGVWEVDSQLARDTKERMIEVGIGCDIISVARPPMHNVPLFRYKNRRSQDMHKAPYDLPYWVHLSFYDPKGVLKQMQLTSSSTKNFIPCCKMPEAYVAFRDYLENNDTNEILVPKYNFGGDVEGRVNLTLATTRVPYAHFNNYDDNVFSQPQSSISFVGSFSNKRNTDFEKNVSNLFLDYARANDSGAFLVGSHNSAQDTDYDVSEPGSMRKRSESMDLSGTSATRMSLSTTPGHLHASQSSSTISLMDDEIANTIRNKKKNKKPLTPLVAPESSATKKSSSRRRWMHLFFRAGENTYTNTYPYPPSWKSLCEPASLPLTTDYFPSASDLNKMYTEYNTIISLVPDENPYQNNTAELLKELICQRLAQGYQLVVSHDFERSHDVNDKKRSFSLSVGHDYHKLTFDANGQNIEIKRYLYKHTLEDKPKPFSYSFKVWPLNHEIYVPMKLDVPHEAASQFPWNYLDNLVCGYYSDLIESLRYQRIRFVLSPTLVPSISADKSIRSSDDPALRVTSKQLEDLPLSKSSERLPVTSSSFEGGTSSPVTSHHDVDKINAAFIKFKNMILVGIVKAQPTAKPDLDITIVTPHKLDITTTPNLTPKVPHASDENRPTTPNANATPTLAGSTGGMGGVGGITIMTSTGSIINTVSTGFEIPNSNSNNNSNSTQSNATSSTLSNAVSEKNLSSLIQQAQQSSQSIQTSQSLSVLLDPTNRNEILVAMQKQETGLVIKDRKYHLRNYKKCFVGSECVDWIVKNINVAGSRDEAIKLGQQLMDEGYLEHVVDRKDFLDGYYFYRIKEDNVNKANAITTALEEVPINSNAINTENTSITTSSSGSGTGANTTITTTTTPIITSTISLTNSTGSITPTSQTPVNNPPSLLSSFIINPTNTISEIPKEEAPRKLDRTLKIDIDPSKSDRPEWMVLKYDSLFLGSNRYFHFEIDWIVGTPCIIEDIIANFQRKAKMSGISLFQIPIDKTSNPFLAPIRVPLLTKYLPHLKNTAFVQALMAKYDFIQEPDEGFIHKTAIAVVNTSESGFLWYYNHLPSMKAWGAKAQAIYKEFAECCANHLKLQSIVETITISEPNKGENVEQSSTTD